VPVGALWGPFCVAGVYEGLMMFLIIPSLAPEAPVVGATFVEAVVLLWFLPLLPVAVFLALRLALPLALAVGARRADFFRASL
jgi:hypothetical protein